MLDIEQSTIRYLLREDEGLFIRINDLICTCIYTNDLRVYKLIHLHVYKLIHLHV